MSELVKLAKQILQHAEQLENQLKEAKASDPTLEAGRPALYPDPIQHPEIFETRTSITTMANDLLQLALGPADALRGITTTERLKPIVLGVIDHFNLPDIVPQEGSISFSELSRKINVDQGILERVLRFAFAFNLFKEEPVGNIRHTALSQASALMAGWTRLMVQPYFNRSYEAWSKSMEVHSEPAKPGVRQTPFNVGNNHDMGQFDWMASQPGQMEVFTKAMHSGAVSLGGGAQAIFSKGYDWASLGEGPIVDLGGGNGHISLAIAKEHPNLRIIVQDLPQNEKAFKEVIPEELKGRISYQPQDFFKPQAKDTGAKLIFMKSICHDWPDVDAARILKNLVPEVEKGTKVLIIDRVLPPPGRKANYHETMSITMDLIMWTVLAAKERNRDQWDALLKMADERLKILNIHKPLASEYGFIEAGF